ncbi:MAG: hypothetical protein LBJ00_02515 [Planctomycetaceae bacterium]|nr:hypothetical protein [Planctomycetaceae bacterium]
MWFSRIQEYLHKGQGTGNTLARSLSGCATFIKETTNRPVPSRFFRIRLTMPLGLRTK